MLEGIFIMNTEVRHTLDHLFRHEYGSIVAGLTARFGVSNIEWIEDAVQEALYKAMKVWGFKNIPDKPNAWLYRVAHHALIDRLRKEKRQQDLKPEENKISEDVFEIRDSKDIQDEQLQMIFACCNPAFSEKNSLLLSLKLIGGFSVKEIARAMLMKDEAAKKSIQRARSDFQLKAKDIQLPNGPQLELYLSRVLKVIYLIFNEGYKASDGDQLVKEDLCGEALRLALLLSHKDHCRSSELLSLISLICFKASRFDARIDEQRQLVLLENQNRNLYNQEYVNWGYYYFNEAGKFVELTHYFLEAAIEYQYHQAPSFGDINWSKVLALHQRLQEIRPSARGRLNYFIVYSRVHGAEVTLKELEGLESDLKNDHLFYAFKAELFEAFDQFELSEKALLQADLLVRNKVEGDYLKRRLAALRNKKMG